LDIPETDFGLMLQGVKVGEVRDMGKVEDGDVYGSGSIVGADFIQNNPILFRQV
jgi:hypothetical protein